MIYPYAMGSSAAYTPGFQRIGPDIGAMLQQRSLNAMYGPRPGRRGLRRDLSPEDLLRMQMEERQRAQEQAQDLGERQMNLAAGTAVMEHGVAGTDATEFFKRATTERLSPADEEAERIAGLRRERGETETAKRAAYEDRRKEWGRANLAQGKIVRHGQQAAYLDELVEKEGKETTEKPWTFQGVTEPEVSVREKGRGGFLNAEDVTAWKKTGYQTPELKAALRMRPTATMGFGEYTAPSNRNLWTSQDQKNWADYIQKQRALDRPRSAPPGGAEAAPAGAHPLARAGATSREELIQRALSRMAPESEQPEDELGPEPTSSTRPRFPQTNYAGTREGDWRYRPRERVMDRSVPPMPAPVPEEEDLPPEFSPEQEAWDQRSGEIAGEHRQLVERRLREEEPLPWTEPQPGRIVDFPQELRMTVRDKVGMRRMQEMAGREDGMSPEYVDQEMKKRAMAESPLDTRRFMKERRPPEEQRILTAGPQARQDPAAEMYRLQLEAEDAKSFGAMIGSLGSGEDANYTSLETAANALAEAMGSGKVLHVEAAKQAIAKQAANWRKNERGRQGIRQALEALQVARTPEDVKKALGMIQSRQEDMIPSLLPESPYRFKEQE